MADLIDDAEETRGRARDPELLAIERCVRIIEGIEDECSQARCIEYLTARYAPRTRQLEVLNSNR